MILLFFSSVFYGCKNQTSLLMDNVVSTTYKITYSLGEGVEGEPPVDDNEYVGGQTIALALAPLREGYTFGGWQNKLGQQYNAGTNFQMPYRDVIFTAIWIEGSFFGPSLNYYTVSMPDISPYFDEVPAGTTIDITCSTPEAEIFYTTDGSVPSRESTKYVSPVAIKDEINDSYVVERKYKVIGDVDPSGDL